jgi:hypothetical protein
MRANSAFIQLRIVSVTLLSISDDMAIFEHLPALSDFLQIFPHLRELSLELAPLEGTASEIPEESLVKMLAKTVTTVVTKLEGLVRLSIGRVEVLDSELLWSTLVQSVSPKITHQRVARDGADIIVGMTRCQFICQLKTWGSSL